MSWNSWLGLFCCGGQRRGHRRPFRVFRKRILSDKKPRVTVKVDGGALGLEGHHRHTLSRDPSSPISVFSEGDDGYESATSELHYPDGITSPLSSPIGSGYFDGVTEVDVLEPESPNTGCIGKRPPGTGRRYVCTSRPKAGSSVRQQTEPDDGSASCSVEEADARTFMVRSLDYMRTKVKEPSEQAIYRLVGADIYSFDFKIFHIAQHVQLPKPPTLGPKALALPPNQQLPPILVINLQLPMYSPSLFGGNDGPGHSLVYYFALPEGWEPDQVPNKEALSLLQRFVHDGQEFDGQPTRDRLKFIPRIVNVEEWAVKGPLSGYEHRLLNNYNDKPILTRPQQRFHKGQHYLEIDMDVHNYAYFARKVFFGFINRLAPVVFENAFVVQGNRPEELPEQIMAAVRVYRVDFTRSRPFPAQTLEERGLLQHRGSIDGHGSFAAAAAAAVVDADRRSLSGRSMSGSTARAGGSISSAGGGTGPHGVQRQQSPQQQQQRQQNGVGHGDGEEEQNGLSQRQQQLRRLNLGSPRTEDWRSSQHSDAQQLSQQPNAVRSRRTVAHSS